MNSEYPIDDSMADQGAHPTSLELNTLPGEAAEDAAPSLHIGYLITAGVFLALGFLLATLLGTGGGSSGGQRASQVEIAQAVQGTLIALTPPPTPIPTAVPVQLTFSEQDPVLGSADAPITIVEFSDYRCPYCRRFAEETLNPLLAQYEGLVKFVYRDYPIFGDPSLLAAHAAQCAFQQGQFWEYHDAIFTSQSQEQPLEFTDANFIDLAATLNLDVPAFTECLSDDQVEQALVQNIINAQTLLGQAGTPTFLVNGQRVVGALPLDYFIPIINEELAKLGLEPPQS